RLREDDRRQRDLAEPVAEPVDRVGGGEAAEGPDAKGCEGGGHGSRVTRSHGPRGPVRASSARAGSDPGVRGRELASGDRGREPSARDRSRELPAGGRDREPPGRGRDGEPHPGGRRREPYARRRRGELHPGGGSGGAALDRRSARRAGGHGGAARTQARHGHSLLGLEAAPGSGGVSGGSSSQPRQYGAELRETR